MVIAVLLISSLLFNRHFSKESKNRDAHSWRAIRLGRFATGDATLQATLVVQAPFRLLKDGTTV